jgi:hypothetical protein
MTFPARAPRPIAMTFAQIASGVGLSYGTVYTDYRRALAKLGLDYRQMPRRIRRSQLGVAEPATQGTRGAAGFQGTDPAALIES